MKIYNTLFILLSIGLFCLVICTDPQPIREEDGYGADDPGPRIVSIDRLNLDQLKSPPTDKGKFPNLKYSFANSHMRLEDGGWTREVTVHDLPVSKTLAGVNMRLKAGAIRELHWHLESEWAYVLYGSCRITAVDEEGRNFISDTGVGDLWYFPSGIPHSLQGLEDDGCEFLLVFDDGDFSADSTFLLTDWIRHTPKDILAKNFDYPIDAFKNVPDKELYIFQGTAPKGSLEQDRVVSPQGTVPQWFSHKMLAQAPIQLKHGTARITDSKNFPISKTIASALVELYPGGLRELHWHPNADEWMYVIEGTGRMTVFAAMGRARTYSLNPTDVAYIPKSMGHYVENTGNTTMRFLEMFKSDKFMDVSLSQWLALTPKNVVESHVHLPDDLMEKLPKIKKPIV
ncbi:oxalate decarboxylase [Acrasis kona]|uniref:Oxalate decarboxylase n=1 Tax=Acrasis kona TaxID=1008807 RepID=A0AAW2ZPR7_9EUKA